MFRKFLAIGVCVLLFAVPTVAQDATPEAEATAPAPDTSIVVEDGATLNIDTQPDTPPDSANTPVSTNALAVIVGAVIVFVLGVGSAILLGGKPADVAISTQLEMTRMNTAAVSEMRAALQSSNETTRQIASVLRDVVKTIAPLTPARSDDELAKLLGDITTPTDDTSTAATG